MTEALVVIVGGVVLTYVLRPLFRHRSTPLPDPHSRSDVEVEKRRAFSALADLKDDELVGKVSPEDAARLRPRIEREALDALNADAEEAHLSDDAELEREIAAAARRLGSPSDATETGSHT